MHEPMPPQIRPDTPVNLSDAAKLVWNGLMPILEQMKVLTTADKAVLERYCELFTLWQKARDVVVAKGAVMGVYELNRKTGERVVVAYKDRPELKQMLMFEDKLLRVEREFGLTPAARASITLPGKPKDKHEKDKILEYFG